MVLWLAPVGAFGAMAAVVGATGFDAVIQLGWLMLAFYITCALFVFLVLGVLVYLSGTGRFVWTTLISAIVSGLTAWLLAPPGSITAGASGVIFGYLTYLLVRGFYSRKIGQILLAVVVFAIYGTVLLGVLPGTPGVSWQGHLGGAVGGVLSAWWLHGRDLRRIR